MTPDAALELSIEQLIGALSKKLSLECTRVQVEFPPKPRTPVTNLIAEVDALEKRAKHVLDEVISMRDSLWLIDHLPSTGTRDGSIGDRQVAEPVSPTSGKNNGAQTSVWEHLIACSLSVDECASCATAYTSLVRAILCNHDEAGTIEYLGVNGGQSFINAMDKTLDKLAPWLQKKCLHVLREVCGRSGLLPSSIRIPVCYDRSDSPLYRSGHADVWKIEHQGRHVAVKELRIYSTSDFEMMTSGFCKEVVTWKTLRHPNVLPLLWVTMENSRFAMASEWMENGNINAFVEANRGANRVELLKDAAKGLTYLHGQEITHGNLKGANILVDQNNRALLADFGILTISSDINSASFGSGTDAGATRWMSPELLYPEHFGFTDSKPTKQSDYYALGMVILEVLSGKTPFGHLRDILVTGRVIGGERPTRPEGSWFTDDLWEILERSWSPRPKDRPTVEAILERLECVPMTLQQLTASAADDGVNTDAGRATPRSGDKPPVLPEISPVSVSDRAVMHDGEVAPPEVTISRRDFLIENEEQNIEREVGALLDKLTMDKFDSISDQIIAWANKSETEKDGQTLIHIIRLIFERATDQVARSEIYARLCRKMMEAISPNVRDDGIRNTDGKPIAGGQLFRKYLLDRCQESFERSLVLKAPVDHTVGNAVETSGEAELYSDGYHAAQEVRRRGFCLIQFLGELYKVRMLTEFIMHECIRELLGTVENPGEEKIESLYRLLTTVGKLLDNPKARAHMDTYFTRMKELGKSSNVAPRVQSMLQDLIELRERKWIPRNQIVTPTTTSQAHEEAAKQRAQAEKEVVNRTLAMSREDSWRGGDRSGGPAGKQQTDSLSVAVGSTPRPPPKAGDISNFGKIKKSGPVVMGPSTVWAGKKDSGKRGSTPKVNSSSNMFTIFRRNGEVTSETSWRASRPSGRRTSVDLDAGGAAEPQQRKLQLLPRSEPVEEENEANEGSPDRSEDEGGDETQPMSEEEANRKVAKDVKEFFGARNIDESEIYFTRLPPEHHHRLVDKLVSRAIESKEADGKLVADAFARAAEKNLCSNSAFEEGFSPVAEFLDDIVIDAPKAFQIMATMMKGAGLDRGEEQRARIAQKSMDSDKLLGLLA